MSDGDEDQEYQTQFNELTDVFDNLFKTAARDRKELRRETISIVKANPTAACAHALAYSLFKNSSENARDTDTFVCATATIFASSEGSNLVTDSTTFSDDPSPIDFYTELYVTLEERINYGFGDNGHNPRLEISPSNPTLQAALFSGSVVSGLMKDSGISLFFAREGLRLEDITLIDADQRELIAVCGCLQLVIAGAPMVEQGLDMEHSLSDVIKALEKLKEDDVIQHPGGV